MSNASDLRERLARLAPVRDVSRAPLSSEDSVSVVLHRGGELDQSIPLIRRLFDGGMTLRGAHAVVNRLAEFGWMVCAVSKTEDLARFAADLASMNVEVRRWVSTQRDPPDIAKLRARHGMSQREYADLLGIDVRTLQNWEQGRNRPDPAAVNLMRIFAHAPEVFEEALSEPLST